MTWHGMLKLNTPCTLRRCTWHRTIGWGVRGTHLNRVGRDVFLHFLHNIRAGVPGKGRPDGGDGGTQEDPHGQREGGLPHHRHPRDQAAQPAAARQRHPAARDRTIPGCACVHKLHAHKLACTLLSTPCSASCSSYSTMSSGCATSCDPRVRTSGTLCPMSCTGKRLQTHSSLAAACRTSAATSHAMAETAHGWTDLLSL